MRALASQYRCEILLYSPPSFDSLRINPSYQYPKARIAPHILSEEPHELKSLPKPKGLPQIEQTETISEELVPIESFWGFSRHRALRKRVQKSGIFFTTTLDSVPLRYKPQILQDAMRAEGLNPDDFQQSNRQLATLRAHPLIQKAWSILSRLIEEGRAHRIGELNEILNLVLPMYLKIRKWPIDFVNKLAIDAYKTMDNTIYKEVRLADSDGKPGQLVAAIGLTKASYGKVVYFNKKSQMWEERTGPFGEAYVKDKISIDDWQETVRHFRSPIFWDQDEIPVLSFEKDLPENFVLSRPATLEHIMLDPFGELPPMLSRSQLEEYYEHFNVDTTRPIYFYTGQILEPTKFAVSRDIELRGHARTQVLLELFKTVFLDSDNLNMSLNGQYLYTYNDAAGARMYQAFGFEPVPGVNLKSGNHDWILLRVSPQVFLKKLSEQTDGAVTSKLVESLLQSAGFTSAM